MVVEVLVICFLVLFLVACKLNPKLYFLYHYSGMRLVVEKMFPRPKGEEDKPTYVKPSSFIPWIISIYLVIFGIASARYDRDVHTYEMQISSWQAQMASESRKYACTYLKNLQNYRVPVQPNLLKFWNTFQSLFKNEKNKTGQILIEQTIESYKEKMNDVFMISASLKNLDLSSANLKNGYFIQSDFTNTSLFGANLTNAEFRGVHFEFADFIQEKLITLNYNERERIFLSLFLQEDAQTANIRKLKKKDTPLNDPYYTKLYLEGVNLRALGVIGKIYEKDFMGMLRWVPLLRIVRDASKINTDIIKQLNYLDSIFNQIGAPSILNRVNLAYANLNGTILSGSSLQNTDFQNAKLINTQLFNCDLRNANFKEANLNGANFKLADLTGADFTFCKNITKEQLSEALLLYNSTLPPKIKKELLKTHPQLFKKPDWYSEDKETN